MLTSSLSGDFITLTKSFISLVSDGFCISSCQLESKLAALSSGSSYWHLHLQCADLQSSLCMYNCVKINTTNEQHILDQMWGEKGLLAMNVPIIY